MKSPFLVKIASLVGALWMRSLRIRVEAPEDFRPGVLGLWHRDLLASCAGFKDKGVHVLVSESGDGEIFAQAAQRLGFVVVRGSDSHGATNIRHLLKAFSQGHFVGMALDGPRGPAQKVKPGSPWLARTANVPLWLFDVTYGLHFTLKTWDNFVVPLPLSSIVIRIKYLWDEEKIQDKERLP